MSAPATSKKAREFTVNFANTGTASNGGMGHNWVLTRTANVNDLTKSVVEAGIDKNFIPPNDPRVLTYTPLIGSGEKTSVTFKPAS